MNATMPHPEKARLRKRVQARRKACSALWIQEQSLLLQRRLLSMPEFQQAQMIASYMALPYEVQTDLLHRACFQQGVSVVVPCGQGAGYAWARLEEETRLTVRGAGVREPLRPAWAPGVQPDIILVPVVAVDNTGHRLGHGGGHYDRLLAQTPGFKLALAFDFQCIDTIPDESWDINMDAVVTPLSFTRFLQVDKQ
ncbi:MAG: 5-formyltetrahydrofolate cyclo-ligase [Spartobacteria bacterium]|nr:5-formyltetrahydrofolate cyclo-ligase [Spartobacteria bacterium]